MRKIIAVMNMTLDGNCDHTAGLPVEGMHEHYTELLNQADSILYGRTTFQLMEYWRTILKNPSEEKSTNDFAIAIDKISKIVFSHTLKDVEWDSARLSVKTPQEEVLELKQQSGKNILVGSPSLIIQLMKLNLIDEYQFCVHSVVAGSGMKLFENIKDRTILKLVKTKTFGGSAVMHYYAREKENEKRS